MSFANYVAFSNSFFFCRINYYISLTVNTGASGAHLLVDPSLYARSAIASCSGNR